MNLSQNLQENIKNIKNSLPIEKSFDVIGRDLSFGNTNGYLVFIDGFVKDDIMLWILEKLQSLPEKKTKIKDLKNWIQSHIAYVEVETFTDLEKLELSVLSGSVVLLLDNQNEGILIDARTYPARGPEEPELEKVTRGSKDGLVETIIFNTALIRRRVRDPKLIFEMTTVGKRSKTDIALGYIDDLVDKKLLDNLKQKPSIEFALAIRIFRLFLLLLTGLFNTLGFIIGIVIISMIIFSTKTFSGIRYTWPLIPFNGKALSNVLLRKPIIEIKRNKKE